MTGHGISDGRTPARRSARAHAHPTVGDVTAVASTDDGGSWATRYRLRLRLADHGVLAGSLALAALVEALRDGLLPWSNSVATDAEADSVFQIVGLPALLGLLWSLMLIGHRTRGLTVVGSGAPEYKRVLNASILTFTLVALVVSITGHQGLRAYFFVALPVGTVSLIVSRWSLRRWLIRRRRAGQFLARAIVIGTREDIDYVVERIERRADAIYDVVGAVVVDGSTHAVTTGSRVVPIVAGVADVARAAWRMSVQSVIVAGDHGLGADYVRDLGWSLEGRATELVLASRMANIAGPRIHFRPVQGLPLMHVDLPQFDGPRHVVKRLTDIALAGVATLLLLPLMLGIALLIRSEGPGPVLFRQERVGRDGRTFSMLKFRSMVVDAESRLADLKASDEGAGLLFKMRDDPRVTRWGRVLRRYSLDELPQLLNIVAGDMSIVGPRPPLPREVDGYEDHVHRRLFIKPGLTGMWQVNGRSDLSWDESVRLDLYYVENWSMTTDLVIMWRTVKVLLRPEGAY